MEPTDWQYTYYPEDQPDDESQPFYVEFIKHPDRRETYRLFKRQWLISQKDWDKHLEAIDANSGWAQVLSREVHPWQLTSGTVNPHENCVDFATKSFLKFTVDALNSKYKTAYERISQP